MNILCVIDSLRSGGSQRQLVELALGFKEKGHVVSFLTYHNIPFYNPVLDKEGILITCIQAPNYIMRLFKMRLFIRRGNYDAVISFLEAPNFICEFASFPYRKWSLLAGERSAQPGIYFNPKLIIYRWFHFLADYIVANSYANMKIVRKVNPLLSKSKCKVIYNTIDFSCWKPSNHYYPRRIGKLKLIMAATHSYLKNLNGLIEALSLLSKEERKKIMVEWYGERISEPYMDGSYVEALKKIKTFNLENIISFYPATLNITKIIQDSDAVGLFSFYEGFPNVICEALACGKPVICSNVSDLPELLSHDMNLLCNPASSESIKCALKYLIGLNNDKLTHIGSVNEKIAREHFNKKTIVSKYLELIEI